MRTIFETADKIYRIIEMADDTCNSDDLKGNCFDRPDLKEQERAFNLIIENEGIFGYVLERWNPEAGIGYEQIDAYWGFVGTYDPAIPIKNHYIVDELKSQIRLQEWNQALKKTGGARWRKI